MSTVIHNGWRYRPGSGRRMISGVAAAVLVLAGSAVTVVGTVAGAAGPAAATGLPVVAAGGSHSCALMPDQSVRCWGLNITGELGNGSTADSLVPVKVTGLPPAADVAAGQFHTCAVDTTSRVWCWGSNAFGELGNGTTSQDSTAPVQVAGVLLASQVSAGHEFSCAVTLAQKVDCWGDNNFGELGNGTTTDSSTPVPVKNLANVIQVAAGYFHACAVESNGTVWCWGDNANGELGNGSTKGAKTPVIVPLQNATQVAAGDGDTCALANSQGDLLCWGANDEGQIGDGTFTDRNTPTQVAGLASGVQQVSMGLDSTCAIASIPAPAALCWGSDDNGKLGNAEDISTDPFPSQVFGAMASPAGGPGGVPHQVAVGGQHACLVATTSVVQCWGDGFDGQLGNGSDLNRQIPTSVIGLPGGAGAVSAVTAGSITGCAVTSGLNAACWGWAVGDGSTITTVHTSATAVAKLPSGGVSQTVAGFGGCALVRTGGLATQVRCWGDNSDGQVGDGTTTDRLKPVTVAGLPSKPEYVAAGSTGNCAIVKGGGGVCWGDNSDGQLGDGNTTSSSTPVAITGLPVGLAQIAAAPDHTCGLLVNQTVECWGANDHGQLGNGTTSGSDTPVPVTGLPPAVAVATGVSSTCALTSAGAVECWGWNADGQLGNSSTSDSSSPVQVNGIATGAVAIAAGADFACAALNTGQIQCWGNNAEGQLGDGSLGGTSDIPVTVGGFTTDGSVGSGISESMCALNTAQQAYCWGDNAEGELGDGTSGTSTDSPSPTAVTGL